MPTTKQARPNTNRLGRAPKANASFLDKLLENLIKPKAVVVLFSLATVTLVVVIASSPAPDTKESSIASAGALPSQTQTRDNSGTSSDTLQPATPVPATPRPVATPPPTFPPPPQALAASSGDFSSAPDLFAALRSIKSRGRTFEPAWGEVGRSLGHLKTLKGASVDAETGQIFLYGEYSDAPGPFLLEDLFVTLEAAFTDLEAPGMTIDEDANNKYGPMMFVRFFAKTENTHLGQVMFEVDRLMKCFGQGRDNITKEVNRPKFEGFLTHAEISQRMNDAQEGAIWSRFWANLATGRFPSNDLRGKVLTEISKDGRTMAILEHRIWVDTEQMFDPGAGHRLKSSGGKMSRSSEAYADELTGKYDEIASEFRVFRDLHEVSKLVDVAEWIRDYALPIDGELLHYRRQGEFLTPTNTPSLASTNVWTDGVVIHSLQMFGGVSLDPKIKYVTPKDPKDKKADPLAEMIENHRSELRIGETVRLTTPDGAMSCLIPVGPPIRSPPQSERVAFTPRDPTRVMEVQSRFRPVSRGIDDPVLGKCEIPIRTDPATGHDMVDMPILRVQFSSKQKKSVTFSTDRGRAAKVEIPEHIYLTSPSRDIAVQFDTQPEFDAKRNEAFFPSTTAEVAGYYPQTRTVRMKNGTEFRFDEAGLPKSVGGPQLPTISFEHPAYQDGPCVQSQSTPATMPRAPPREPVRIMESQSRTAAVPRNLEGPSETAPIRTVIRNADTGKRVEVWDDDGRLYYVVR